MKTKIEELTREIKELTEIKDQLWKALMLVSERDGDFTQNIVNDALYEVGYYTEEEDGQTL